MPKVEFEDKDLLTAIGNETNHDMTDMIIIKKEIVNDKLVVFYRPKRPKVGICEIQRFRGE